MVLNEEICSKIEDHTWINVNGTDYFCKYFNSQIAKEIVAERLAKLVGVHCAHYEYAEVYGIKYYLSEKVRSLVPASELYVLNDDECCSSIYKLWHRLGKVFPLYVDDILKEIIKKYLFDLFILNYDNHDENWGIEIADNRPLRLVSFDNDLAFMFYSPTPWIKANFTNESLTNTMKIELKKHENLRSNLRDLEYFIRRYPKEYVDMLVEMYYLLTPEVVLKVFRKVITETGEDIDHCGYKYIADLYGFNYEQIGKLLRGYGLIDGANRKRERKYS